MRKYLQVHACTLVCKLASVAFVCVAFVYIDDM